MILQTKSIVTLHRKKQIKRDDMSSNPYDINSAVVDFIGRSIIGPEESVPIVNKAVLALYLINIITTNRAIVRDYYQTIGDDNVFQELLLDCDLLDDVLINFVSRNYKKLGRILSDFLITTSRKFVTHVDTDIDVAN